MKKITDIFWKTLFVSRDVAFHFSRRLVRRI